MEIMKQEKEGRIFLKIRGDLSVYEVTELREELLAYFEETEKLILDLREVGECDTSGVQLLYSARITAEDEGKSLEIINVSDPIIKALDRTGLTSDVLF